MITPTIQMTTPIQKIRTISQKRGERKMPLATIDLKDEHIRLIAKELKDFWSDLIYKQIIAIIRKHLPVKAKLSTSDNLLAKINNGSIVYDGEYFYGSFDARSSKELRELGAKWDAKKKGFRLNAAKITPDIKSAMSSSQDRLEKVNDEINGALARIDEGLEEKIKELRITSIKKVTGDLEKQAKKALDAVGLKYAMDPEQKERLEEEYTESIKPYIQEFTKKQTLDLRSDVEENATAGYRYDNLINRIQKRYDVSQSKAEFLAQQETSMYMAKFRKDRFMEAGCEYYEWRTSHDVRVRESHKHLDGRIFRFGDPPIVDPATGRKAEPGEDFRCRCKAIPVLKKVMKRGSEYIVV